MNYAHECAEPDFINSELIMFDKSLFVFNDDIAHLFEFHPFASSIYLTYKCQIAVLQYTELVAMLPGTTTLIYSPGPSETMLSGYCMRAERLLFETLLEVDPYKIICESNIIAICGKRDRDWRIALYRVDDSVLSFSHELPLFSGMYPYIAPNGIMAYHPVQGVVSVFDCNNNTELRSFPVASEIGSVRLNRNGSLLAVEETFPSEEKFLSIFSVSSGERQFHLPLSEQVFLSHRWSVFSADSRFIVLNHLNSLSVIDLRTNDTFNIVLYQPHHFVSCAGFRVIDGVTHLMFISARLLRMYRFDETAGSWTVA